MKGDVGIQGLPRVPQVPGGSWLDDATGGLPPALEQAFDADSLYQLRSCVAAHATESGLSRQRRDDLVMAVHELAANTVRHGPGHGQVRIWRSGSTMICEVSDDGTPQVGGSAQPADPTAVNDGDFPWPSKPGHGLWLVRQISDRSMVRQDAHGVTAVVSFRADPAGSAGQAGSAQSAGSW